MPIMNRSFMAWLAAMVFIGAFGGQRTPAQAPANQPVDVMLVLDNSGSMKQNDPKRLLKQAVTEFASNLPAQSQVGIVLFDQRVDVIQGLTKVSDTGFQSELAQSLSRVDYSGKWTDIPGGIERAIYTLNHDGRPDALHAIVFFTDGIIETGNSAKDLERSKWLREDLAAEAKQRGIRIFGVAFTEASDYELIQSVAQTTGGEHYRVLKPSDIAGTFGEISKKILEPSSLSKPQSTAVTPAQPASWNMPLWVGSGLVLALLVIIGVFLVRRQSSNSRSQEDSEKIPPADYAHMIDVGRHTGEERILLRKRRIRIGRDAKLNDVCIAEATVSSQHAEIEYKEGCYYLRDLRSSNGTFINGKQISDPNSVREAMLKSGDRIRFDAYEFVFNLDASVGEATPGAGNVPEYPRTILRRQPVLVPRQQPPEQQVPAAARADGEPLPVPERVPPTPFIKDEEGTPNAPASTRVRSEFCPAHPAWKATELCPNCGIGKCKQCMTEKNGKAICIDCANKIEGLSA
jgi:pSer/pThr/pTyr-binding forkhead associated (FHA) protein